MRKLLASILATASMLVVSATTHAIPYRADFTASGFGIGAPQDPVSGTVFFDKSAADFSILSLTGIDLTILGHTYALGEIVFDTSAIGGSVFGLGFVTPDPDPANNDFFLDWNVSTGAFVAFQYITPTLSGVPQALVPISTITFSEVSPVPISAVGAGGSGLVVLLLGVAVALGRRRMQQAA